MLGQPQVATNDVFQEANGWILYQFSYHARQDSTNSVKSLRCGTDICQSIVVQEDLLHNKCCDCFRQLGTRFHDAEAERDDLRLQKEIHYVGIVDFDQGTDNAEGGQSQIFKWPMP